MAKTKSKGTQHRASQNRAMRPTWEGHLRLSLVTCPVALYTATSRSSDVHFNMLSKDTHNRIRMVPTDPDTGPVERSEIVKGYEVEKDRYVIVTDEEIKSVRLESTRTIDIERFVDVGEIDRMYWNDPYFLLPDGKMAQEAYAVIREAMKGTERIALGRVVMHTRERLLAIEPREEGLLAYSLRSKNEVRDIAEAFDDIPAVDPNAQMVEIAEKEKGAGTKVKVAEPEDTKVIDLMAALRKSLGQSGGDRRRPPERRAAPTPAKKAPARKQA